MIYISDELDLHSLTVEEAIPKLEQFLYQAFQYGHNRVWIIHGKGMGILRREVSRYLSNHTLVKSFCPAENSRGGTGATKVILSDK